MAAKKSASHRSLKSDPARVDAHVFSAREYQALPELTSDLLARAKLKKGGRLISLRLPTDVIARWKATGPGSFNCRQPARLSGTGLMTGNTKPGMSSTRPN